MKLSKIKEIISPISYGIKTEKGIRPSINKKLAKIGYKRSLTNKLIKNHIEEKDTVYFYGNESNKHNQSLLMIDIDVNKKNKKGSQEGAEKFINHIKKQIKDLYYEKSTNGEGIHGYFTLNKNGYKPKDINIILKKFENWLQKEAEKIQADIELVEVKGTLFEIEYKNKNIKEIKYGMLGKIPRNISAFLEKNISIDIEEIELNYSLDLKKNNNKGSISGKHFSEEELNNLDKYEEVAKEILGDEKIKTGKFNILTKDMAIMLMILMFFKENKNQDMTLPTKRAESIWKALFKSEERVDRGWNHHRWAGMRNILSKKGLIKWIDNRYQINNKSQKVEGISCKWEIEEKVYMYLKNCKKKKQASFVDTKPQSVDENVVVSSSSTFITKDLYNRLYLKPVLSLIIKENYNKLFKNAYECIKLSFSSV